MAIAAAAAAVIDAAIRATWTNIRSYRYARRNDSTTGASCPKRRSVSPMAAPRAAASSKCADNSRRRSSRLARPGICAPATIRSIRAATASWSGMCVTENGAHRGRNARPLAALRLGPAAALRREAVVLSRAPRRAVAPAGLQQAGTLHLMEGGIQRAFLQQEGALAPALGFLQDLVAVHLALG